MISQKTITLQKNRMYGAVCELTAPTSLVVDLLTLPLPSPSCQVNALFFMFKCSPCFGDSQYTVIPQYSCHGRLVPMGNTEQLNIVHQIIKLEFQNYKPTN